MSRALWPNPLAYVAMAALVAISVVLLGVYTAPRHIENPLLGASLRVLTQHGLNNSIGAGSTPLEVDTQFRQIQHLRTWVASLPDNDAKVAYSHWLDYFQDEANRVGAAALEAKAEDAMASSLPVPPDFPSLGTFTTFAPVQGTPSQPEWDESSTLPFVAENTISIGTRTLTIPDASCVEGPPRTWSCTIPSDALYAATVTTP